MLQMYLGSKFHDRLLISRKLNFSFQENGIHVEEKNAPASAPTTPTTPTESLKGILKPPSPDASLKSFPSLPETFLQRLGLNKLQRPPQSRGFHRSVELLKQLFFAASHFLLNPKTTAEEKKIYKRFF